MSALTYDRMACRSLVVLLARFLHLSSAVQTEWLSTSCYGTWDRDQAVTAASRPFLRGAAADVAWSDLEPTEGSLNLQLLNQSLFEAISMNECWYGMVHVGPDSPDWIYKTVPQVQVQDDPKHTFKYPYYLDTNYKTAWFRMVKAVADFVRALPDWVLAYVGFYQVTTGCTGDEIAYKQPPLLAKYDISDAAWDQFRLEAFGQFNVLFQQGSGRPVPLLFNEVEPDIHPTVWPWLRANIAQGLGIKGSAYVRGHHLTGESTWVGWFRQYMVNPAPSDQLIFTRAEMDQSYSNPFFQLNVPLGIYWGILTALNQGLGVHDVSQVPLTDCYSWVIADSYVFFTKYAGQIHPQTATDAFAALHEGLTGEDIVKFPEAQFGDVIRNNGNVAQTEARLTAICNSYKEFGCRMDDMYAAMQGQVYQRASQTGYNDAGWYIQAGNYARFLEQINADTTSQGWFRVGGTLTQTSVKYARFGRGLVHAAGKTGMYFKLTDGFFSITPVGNLTFHVIWYDRLAGSWQFAYADKMGATKIGWNQVSVGDGTWKQVSFVVSDAGMAHGYTLGSDFGIVSNTRTDLIFHMIEVSRGNNTTFPNITTHVPVVIPAPAPTAGSPQSVSGATSFASCRFLRYVVLVAVSISARFVPLLGT